MLSTISKPFQLSPMSMIRASKSSGHAYASYLSHRSFYRKDSFDLLKAVFLDLKEDLGERIYKKEDTKPKGPPKAKCGHTLWHRICMGCSPSNKNCWGRCVCYDWIDYPPTH